MYSGDPCPYCNAAKALLKSKNVEIEEFDIWKDAAKAKEMLQRTNGARTIPQIFIGDTIGEMDIYLGMADIVFVGASFSDWGGHNIVEPLSAGCPVMMGPSTFGIDFIAKDAAAAGIFKSFNSPEQMKSFIITISQSPEKLNELRLAASQFFKNRRSAAELCYEVINSNA